MSDTLLQVMGVSKTFPGNLALDSVSLTIGRGETVALLGHNGSGKSTLVKVLSGLYVPDSGAILTGSVGSPTTLHFIHQNLGLVPALSVVENLDLGIRPRFGGLMPFHARRERLRVKALIAEFGADIDVDQPVSHLSSAERTVVAIARALDGWSGGEHVLVLDEPTASLHGDEVVLLHDAVRALAARGVGIIYISHRLSEVVELADRVVVLKSGRVVAERSRGDFNQRDLVGLIAGQLPAHAGRRQATRGPERLTVRGLASASLDGVSFAAHAGEILGISGLVGSGMEELNASMFGATPTNSGRVWVDGKPLDRMSPRTSIAAGMAFVPADRRTLGSIGQLSARENITLSRLSDLRRARGSVHVARERAQVADWLARVNVLPAGFMEQRFELFSGGNQQKIMLAKWLRMDPGVLLLDEPTQGVDAGAQAEIYELLAAAAREGAAVVVSSSDTKELSALCDRVLVTRDHRIVQEFTGEAVSEASLVRAVLDDTPVATTESRPA